MYSGIGWREKSDGCEEYRLPHRSGVAGSDLARVRRQEDETAHDVGDTRVADVAPCEGLSPATMKTYRQILGPVLHRRRPWRTGGGCCLVSPRFPMPHVARPTAAPQSRDRRPFPLVRAIWPLVSQRGGRGFKSPQLHVFALCCLQKNSFVISPRGGAGGPACHRDYTAVAAIHPEHLVDARCSSNSWQRRRRS
jgi:hypothetical protein